MQMKFNRYVCSFVILLVGSACTHVDEITPRSYVGLLLGDTKPQRDEIAKALSSGKTAPTPGPLALKSKSNGLMTVSVDLGWITSSGTIVVHNKQYGVVVIQEPTVTQGKVIWNCVVYPAEAKPKNCFQG